MHGVHRRGRLERRPARHQRIERRPEGIHVSRRPHVTALAAGLLRRHVARRPHDLARAGQPAVGLQLLGQPEVGDPRVAVLVEQNIGRLQVAVDHAALVGVLDGLAHLRPSVRRPRGAGAAPRPGAGKGSGPSTNPIEK